MVYSFDHDVCAAEGRSHFAFKVLLIILLRPNRVDEGTLLELVSCPYQGRIVSVTFEAPVKALPLRLRCLNVLGSRLDLGVDRPFAIFCRVHATRAVPASTVLIIFLDFLIHQVEF